MYDLNGKVALVTGTSNRKALGCGIALRLAREGADLIVNSRHKELHEFAPWDIKEGWRGLDSLVEEVKAMGRQALGITADVSDSRDVNEMVEKAIQEFGRIDILVNNAAIIKKHVGSVNLVDFDEEAWSQVIKVNLIGVFLMCKAVARQMIKQGHGGKIINISSVAGKRGGMGTSSYSASKFGVIGLTQSLALELAQRKINVNAVCPGDIVTWGTRGQTIYDGICHGLSEDEATTMAYASDGSLQQVPLGRPGTVEDVANMVAFLASNQSDYMTGQAINVSGGKMMVH